MNIEEIRTFLEVVNKESLLKASESLYVSQGTVSTRIKNLEEEFGILLFDRSRGNKNTKLTPAGVDFLPIAQQYLALYQDIDQIRNKKYVSEINIGATGSLNYYLLNDFYNHYSDMNKNVYLNIKSEHSTQLHIMIENLRLDAALVYNLHNFQNIVSVPLFQEDLVIVFHKNSRFSQSRNYRDLKGEQEIICPLSDEITIWHKQTFPFFDFPKVIIGTSLIIPKLMNSEESWIVTSESIAKGILNEKPGYTYQTIKDAPKRVVYLLSHKYPRPGSKELYMQFRSELFNYFKTNENLQYLTLI